MRCVRAQMSVELCIVLPVVIVIAAISFNALSFFSYCASFDRDMRNSVRLWVAAPPSRFNLYSALDMAWTQLDYLYSADNVAISFEYEETDDRMVEVEALLEYRPTLFGLPTRGEVFGVRLPALTHRSQLVVRTDGGAWS